MLFRSDMTEDAGATWVTQSVTSTWTKFCTAHQSFLNPSIGIRIVTNADAVDVWGNQFEAGAFGSSTIPTTTVAVARSTDGVSRTAGGEISSSFGTSFVEWDTQDTTSNASRVFVVDDGSGSNRFGLRIGGGTAFVNTYTFGATVGDGAATTANTMTANVMFKSAAAFAANDLAVVLNGGAAATDSALTQPIGLNRFTLGFDSGGGTQGIFGHVRRLGYWPLRQPNSFLQQVTQPGPQSALKWPTYAANDNTAAEQAA